MDTLEPSAKRARPESLAPEKARIAELVRSVHGGVSQSPAPTSALTPAVTPAASLAPPARPPEGADASAPEPPPGQHAAHGLLVGAHRAASVSARPTEVVGPAPVGAGAGAAPDHGPGLQLRLDPPTAGARAAAVDSSAAPPFVAFKQDYAAQHARISAGRSDGLNIKRLRMRARFVLRLLSSRSRRAYRPRGRQRSADRPRAARGDGHGGEGAACPRQAGRAPPALTRSARRRSGLNAARLWGLCPSTRSPRRRVRA